MLSNILWKRIDPVYQQIISHPFNVELANGTLDTTTFKFYLKQDYLFLSSYSKALAIIASRVKTSQLTFQFLNFALDAVQSEREFHLKYFDETFENIDPSPSCLAYCQFLIATTATCAIEEAVAAVLPCFWIYNRLGCDLADISSPLNPYSAWINMYASRNFSESTSYAISIFDSFAEQTISHTHQLMAKAFIISTHYEYHFWDEAYKQKLFLTTPSSL